VDLTFHESDERLELYALDRLSDSDVIRIEEHLLICVLCRDRLDETANFAFSVREELRNNPVPIRQPRNWFSWLNVGFRPQFALAGALALAVLAVVVLRTGHAPLAAVATLQLQAMRGSDVQSVTPARELDLTFGDAPEGGVSLSVEVVDAGGAAVWRAAPQLENGKVVAKIAKELAPGEYYARLYDSGYRLVHEYSFRVKK